VLRAALFVCWLYAASLSHCAAIDSTAAWSIVTHNRRVYDAPRRTPAGLPRALTASVRGKFFNLREMNLFHSQLLVVVGEIALGLSVLVFVGAALAAFGEKFRSNRR
jgi:hypothetical protein